MTKICDICHAISIYNLAKNFDTLFMNVATGAVALNRSYAAWKAFVDGLTDDDKVAFSEKHPV